MLCLGLLATMTVWALVNYISVNADQFYSSSLPCVMILFTSHILYFMFTAFVIPKPTGYKYIHLLRAIGICSMLLFNIFKSQQHSDFDSTYGFFIMINYDVMFMAQGLVDTTFKEEYDKRWEELKDTPLVPLSMFTFFLMYAECCPTASL